MMDTAYIGRSRMPPKPKGTLASKASKGTIAAARTAEERRDDAQERRDRIKLPEIGFLSRRFGWEPAVPEKYRP